MSSASLYLCLAAQDRKLSLSGRLGLAVEALKRQVRAKQQRWTRAYPQIFSLFDLLSRLLADRAGRKNEIAATFITFEEPPLGYDVLGCVGGGAAIAPVTSRSSSYFIASIVVTEAAENRPRLHRGC